MFIHISNTLLPVTHQLYRQVVFWALNIKLVAKLILKEFTVKEPDNKQLMCTLMS